MDPPQEKKRKHEDRNPFAKAKKPRATPRIPRITDDVLTRKKDERKKDKAKSESTREHRQSLGLRRRWVFVEPPSRPFEELRPYEKRLIFDAYIAMSENLAAANKYIANKGLKGNM
eukprot:CAMPEP_0114536416 /NCGR_PEP_ID=MMETSP0109-20121206/28992_1 /TAXON_ID=29199 /ORGANISM="Chlorarachnion reptans, Strain CCCM449" /LENGTH=115 /DNA_ID=CAMNT_0001720155 /DNA_START=134 /DNA_END=481 /DNA_ORIENTATION=+